MCQDIQVRRRFSLVLCAGLALLLATSSTQGLTLTDYDNETDFLDAAGGVSALTLESFEAFTVGTSSNPFLADHLALTEADLGPDTRPGGTPVVRDLNELGPVPEANEHPTEGSQYLLYDATGLAPGDATTITFDSFDVPIRHFGIHIVDWGDSLSGQLSLTIGTETILVADNTVDVFASGNVIFIGVISDVFFSEVVLTTTTTSDSIILDELYFPEPTTALLLATGVVGLAVRRKRGLRLPARALRTYLASPSARASRKPADQGSGGTESGKERRS